MDNNSHIHSLTYYHTAHLACLVSCLVQSCDLPVHNEWLLLLVQTIDMIIYVQTHVVSSTDPSYESGRSRTSSSWVLPYSLAIAAALVYPQNCVNMHAHAHLFAATRGWEMSSNRTMYSEPLGACPVFTPSKLNVQVQLNPKP